MDKDRIKAFKKTLDSHYAWPALYPFKFIVPKNKLKELVCLFPMHNIKKRASKNGNYIGVTIEMMLPSTDAVVDVYMIVSKIEGIVAL